MDSYGMEKQMNVQLDNSMDKQMNIQLQNGETNECTAIAWKNK